MTVICCTRPIRVYRSIYAREYCLRTIKTHVYVVNYIPPYSLYADQDTKIRGNRKRYTSSTHITTN